MFDIGIEREIYLSVGLNILMAINWLASVPQTLSQSFTSITLGKTIMMDYVHYNLGVFDWSCLRGDFIKDLVYDLILKTISL